MTLDGLDGTRGTRELHLLITFTWLEDVFTLENTVCHQLHSQYTRGKCLLLHCSFQLRNRNRHFQNHWYNMQIQLCRCISNFSTYVPHDVGKNIHQLAIYSLSTLVERKRTFCASSQEIMSFHNFALLLIEVFFWGR